LIELAHELFVFVARNNEQRREAEWLRPDQLRAFLNRGLADRAGGIMNRETK